MAVACGGNVIMLLKETCCTFRVTWSRTKGRLALSKARRNQNAVDRFVSAGNPLICPGTLGLN